MLVKELKKMMYAPTRIQIQTDHNKVLFKGTIQELDDHLDSKEIKHVWGQADLDGMKIIVRE